LYHNALSSGVAIEDVLKYARKTKEMAAAEGDGIADLRLQIAEQAKLIRTLVARGTSNEIEMGERSSLLQEKPKTSNGGVFLPKGKPTYGSSDNGNVSVSLGDSVNKGAADVLGLHKLIQPSSMKQPTPITTPETTPGTSPTVVNSGKNGSGKNGSDGPPKPPAVSQSFQQPGNSIETPALPSHASW
jgi:hypothetical protein